MEYKELKNKGKKELHELLAEKRDELRELRFKAHEKQLKNVRSIRVVKKDIAYILTAINAQHVSVAQENAKDSSV
ncbi:MAG TPA: 50S ribosomal protein L29 [Candidatus Magasanikbacteria bacterium]|nr:MAG: 50S ribosomal protein L29 [Candidatus Magasanikbacteria bacterium RIFOXYC2_FULL_39_8]HAT03716.1 50S ribosomal protein L29 [Candidatus Magasanikbacteria bacterium]